jgi:hypothetical protein
MPEAPRTKTNGAPSPTASSWTTRPITHLFIVVYLAICVIGVWDLRNSGNRGLLIVAGSVGAVVSVGGIFGLIYKAPRRGLDDVRAVGTGAGLVGAREVTSGKGSFTVNGPVVPATGTTGPFRI